MKGKAVAYKFQSLESFEEMWGLARHFVDICVFDLTPSALPVWDVIAKRVDMCFVVTDGDPDAEKARQKVQKDIPDSKVICTKGFRVSGAFAEIPRFYMNGADTGGARRDVLGNFETQWEYPDWCKVLASYPLIGVGNQKGGVGKSTVSLSIVRKFYDAGGSALYCEVDNQAGSVMLANGLSDFQRIFT